MLGANFRRRWLVAAAMIVAATACREASPGSGVDPSASEACNALDDDRDGAVDEEGASGCGYWYRDADGDGFGDGPPRCLCAADTPWTALSGGDCDDGDGQVGPLRREICNAGRDDDCDGTADVDGSEGCVDRWVDPDGDGWGTGAPRCLCEPSEGHVALGGGDCAEGDPAIHPGAFERCDAVDQDCDGSPYSPHDVGAPCVSGRGACAAPGVIACTADGAGSYCTGDEGTPGTETCNGYDDDCDGEVDEPGTSGCVVAWPDGDGDGFGAGASACVCDTSPPWGGSAGGDCDDADPAVWPGAPETCNGRDDDCDGAADEGTVAELCGSTPNATATCEGECALTCEPDWHDYDGAVGTGCECMPDPADLAGAGNGCLEAVDAGTLLPGRTLVIEGNLVPRGDIDHRVVTIGPYEGGYWWIRVRFDWSVNVSATAQAYVISGSTCDYRATYDWTYRGFVAQIGPGQSFPWHVRFLEDPDEAVGCATDLPGTPSYRLVLTGSLTRP